MKQRQKNTAPASPVHTLESITERAFFYALMMIDIANNRREEPPRGEPKVGGHPSACASSRHILAAIHLGSREPEDYFAIKPHVSPLDHAFNYLLHNFRHADGRLFNREESETAMRNFRKISFTGEPVFQSYHAESDPDSFRYFPSGSVGIPPVNALYTALGYKFLEHHGHRLNEDPRFWCLMGDSEFREGSLAEAMPDAGERELSNVIWIVDYNRQNLDGTRISNELAFNGSDAERMVRIGKANGWDTLILKHGTFRQQVFAASGGAELQRVLDEETSDFEFQSMLGAEDPKFPRKWLREKSARLDPLLKKMSDDELWRLLTNVGGHDMHTLVDTFKNVRSKKANRPTLIVAYTIKGYGLQCQARSGNHSALPEADELLGMAAKLGLSVEDPFRDYESGSAEADLLAARRKHLLEGVERIAAQVKRRREEVTQITQNIDWPHDFNVTALKFNPVAHTQWMWGQIAAKLDRLGRETKPLESEADNAWKKVAKYFVTMAPDVGSSTNTSPNMNGKLFGNIEQPDFETVFGAKDSKAPDVMPNLSSKTGHIRFEIAEGNCMSAAGSFGKFAILTGVPLFPAMTIYDFFIKRAHDQFYYNLYWHSSFMTVGTPSGVTLAPEGAQHSWKSDFQIPNCVTWEPAFAREVEWILADTLRRHFTFSNAGREGVLVRCVTKGLNQKEWLANLKEQKRFEGQAESVVMSQIRDDVLSGGYCLIDRSSNTDYVPGDNAVHLFCMGALVDEAISASNQLLEKGICANVFVVTSPDLLLGNYADADGYAHLREKLGVNGRLYWKNKRIEDRADWLALRGARIPIVAVHDGEPGLLDNIGSIVGVRQRTLAIRKTSKSGTTQDVYRYHHIDSASIVSACHEALEEISAEEFVVAPQALRGKID